ncbi:MAG: glycine--tRNA ligase subunit beta, partial [Candidatus Gastranaerophilales bacterium]|nr:glycine--tRNA ligase subunit beta [Candidatus Gastranaerophilales bacterium]
MTKYLLELGTEELPYKFIPSAMEQLKEQFYKKLEDNRVKFETITTYGTPRRLCVIVEGLTESQPDLIKQIKGPPAKVAFDSEGNLTPAGNGFANKQRINSKGIYKELVGEIEYIFAEICDKGKKTAEVLQDIVPEIIFDLQGSHFMRWADFDVKFSRPIRWIVSLMDTEEVKIKIADITSTRYSRGHRFHANKEVNISSPDNYLDELYNAKVIVDQKRRYEEVIKQAESIARSVGGKVSLDPDLVEEVTYIVEWPVSVLGSFDEKYLVIPKDVIVCVMASHQRYFPVFSVDGKKLLNHFITMANYEGSDFDNIKRGNERVIKARLDDAIFFYTEDTKRTLESRIEDLKGVTFQKGLGSIHDKTSRIREIAFYISEELELDKATVKNIEKAALLCKADLVTSLVREFTELQGVIGGNYAKIDGESDFVAEGIREHYLPISADSELAETITGQVVGIADKIDTISGVFSIGKIPTGSADPLGLRRAALGIILTLIKKDININLSKVIENAVSIQPVKIADKDKLINDIREFIIQRLRISLQETYRYDVVEAAFGAKDPLADINDLMKRLEKILALVNEENYSSIHDAANRIIRILKSEKTTISPNPEYFA